MARHFLISLLFVTLVFDVFGQSLQNKVYHKFISADSVILVSHLTTQVPIYDENTHQRIGIYRLVEKSKVNYKIIKERYSLDKNETDSIAKIIITPNNDSTIEDIRCFMPHHGILIFKKGKCSYFDICFGCRHFVTSKDIKLTDELDDKTWNALESFFRNRKLNYELTESDSETKDDN